jgi:hypothetical protein
MNNEQRTMNNEQQSTVAPVVMQLGVGVLPVLGTLWEYGREAEGSKLNES